MTPDHDTRRAHPRRNVPNVDMFCYRASPSATPQMRRNIGAEILDISQGGARVRVSEAVGRGETVTLELRDRASGESFRARGEVRWAISAGLGHLLGVQFSEHYTPVGEREVFTLGASPTIKMVPKKEVGGDILITPDEKRKSERFALKDYTVTLYRQGTLAAQGLKRNLGRTILDISSTGAQIEVSAESEVPTLSSEGRKDFAAGLEAWNRYLKQAGDEPSPTAAQLVGVAFLRLAEASLSVPEAVEHIATATKAQRIAAEERPNINSLSTLGIYQYFNGEYAAGDKTTKRAAAAAASKAEAKAVETQLAEYRKNSKAFAKQKKEAAKFQGEAGKESLQSPFGLGVPPGG